MDASDVKTAQLPLDFSLNVKSEALTNLNILVKSNGDSAPTTNMLISPDKNSQSAFKVVTPKHNADGMLYNIFHCQRSPAHQAFATFDICLICSILFLLFTNVTKKKK